MTFLKFVLLSVTTAVCVFATAMDDKCAVIQRQIGRPCSPTACTNRNTSCPLIPDVLCASDECGCHVAFLAVRRRSGREARMDVTDLCRATVQIKEATDFMDRLLTGEMEERNMVASDPDVLFRVFKGLNALSVGQLQNWLWSLNSFYPHDRSPPMEKRRHFLLSELAALEERIRQRESDDMHSFETRVITVSEASSKEAQKELHRRREIVRQWTKRQERVKIFDESVSMYTFIASARTASRKYAVNSQGTITGSQWPIYGNILYSFIRLGGGISDDKSANGKTFMVNDPDNASKITELYNQLKHIVLDEAIARSQLRRNGSNFALPPTPAPSSRVTFNFRSFAPLLLKAGGFADGNAILRLMSMAAQTAALGMDLHRQMLAHQSPTTLAGFVLDWNITDDLTEFLF